MTLSTALVTLLLSPHPGQDAPVNGIKSASIPLASVEANKGLSDMAPLKGILKDVRIVGMGEPTHGSREVFQMKHRMFEFLVKEMGYTVFAIEASMPDCVAMDRYVMTGQGDVNRAVRSQGFWTWATEEVADLVKWMRKYNEDPKNKTKLRVVGFDMQSRLGAAFFLRNELTKVGVGNEDLFRRAGTMSWKTGDLSEIEKAVSDALPKVREKFGEEHERLVKQMGVVFKQAFYNDRDRGVKQTAQNLGADFMPTVKKSGTLLKAHPELKGDALEGLQLLEKSSNQVYNPTASEKSRLRDYAKALRAYGEQATRDKQDLTRSADILEYFALSFENLEVAGVNYRDKCMAENMSWIVNEYLPGSKAMAWAHNMHLARWEPKATQRMMGAYLNDTWKDQYYPVGFSFNKGSFQAMDQGMKNLQSWTVDAAPEGSLDHAFSRTGISKFFLDLKGLDSKTKTWFDSLRGVRTIGALYNPEYAQQYMLQINPIQSFSGMIFIDETTRARPLPR